MVSKARLYLDDYRNRFMEQERLFRYRIQAWGDVMKEVVIDRGSLLGSKEYQEITGIERASALNKIDDALADCYENIARLRHHRDSAVSVRYPFNNRCARIRRQVSMLDDVSLGKGDEGI
jgi:hypothetical protein